ncbi:uncharacterized protein VTP21DRAFT_4296 [Calcarisporiella thermophila]|uniref:uncharacterized protein n=1 Tax=Calcarisporiella thermophila TaxID=911321 RepID=UPI0037422ABC
MANQSKNNDAAQLLMIKQGNEPAVDLDPGDTITSAVERLENDCRVLVSATVVAGKKRRVEDEGPSKKPDLDYKLKGKTHFRRIMAETLKDPKEYSSPNKVMLIPFPFLGAIPAIRFDITDGCFGYMGREGFARVLAEVESFIIRTTIKSFMFMGVLDQNEKGFIEDLTGRTPLFQRVLLSLERNKDFKDMGPDFLNSQELKHIPGLVESFAIRKKNESSQLMYVDTTCGCLLKEKMLNSVENYDHNYFYFDENFTGHYTCGLARDVMTGLFRELGEDMFLNPKWLSSYMSFQDNPAALGTILEQASLNSISHNVAGLELPSMKTIVCRGIRRNGTPVYDTKFELALYVPFACNLRAITGLILSLDEKNKTAHLVPIQINLGRDRSDSESRFLANWNSWTQGLMVRGDSVRTTFLWITEGKHATDNLEAKIKETRRRAILKRPEHASVCVAIEDVVREVGERLS